MRARAILVLCLLACGSSEPPPKKESPVLPPAKSTKIGAKKGGKPTDKGAPAVLSVMAKVPDALRKELGKDDFAPDPSGEVNRDPFRSYVTGLPAEQSDSDGKSDECEKRMVAPDSSLHDLKLMGVVLNGTRGYAMFTDKGQMGFIAHRGDCLSRERVRVRDIGSDRVVLQIPSLAAPGGSTPAPRAEVWRVHPEELGLPPSTPPEGGEATP